MTRAEHAAHARMAVEALHAEIEAAKARRPSCAWPRQYGCDGQCHADRAKFIAEGAGP